MKISALLLFSVRFFLKEACMFNKVFCLQTNKQTINVMYASQTFVVCLIMQEMFWRQKDFRPQ